MADLPSKGRPGPPTLRPGEPSREFCIRVPVSDYALARTIAEQHQISIAAVYRSAFRIVVRRQATLAG